MKRHIYIFGTSPNGEVIAHREIETDKSPLQFALSQMGKDRAGDRAQWTTQDEKGRAIIKDEHGKVCAVIM